MYRSRLAATAIPVRVGGRRAVLAGPMTKPQVVPWLAMVDTRPDEALSSLILQLPWSTMYTSPEGACMAMPVGPLNLESSACPSVAGAVLPGTPART